MSNNVESRTSFAATPKDGLWYALPNDQYIRWNPELGMWDEMIVRDGVVLTSGHVAAGTELSGVVQ